MNKFIENILPTAEVIERLLSPHAEVVVHDITANKIVAIYNTFSKRKEGDSSLLPERDTAQASANCVGPYEKINWDGRKLKSVSSLIRGEDNMAVGMLCINLDVSMFDKLSKYINQFISFADLKGEIDPLFKDDWREKINTFIHQYLNKNHLLLETLSRKEKKTLVEHLHKNGAFLGKNSANYVAQIIKVSRATVYNYLSEFSKN